MRILLLALLLAAGALAQRHKVNINTETPEGQALQQIGQEADDAKKLAMLEKFTQDYAKSENLPWVYTQMQPLYTKANQPDKALEMLSSGTVNDPALGTDPGLAATRQARAYLLLGNSEYDPRREQFGADCFHCHGGALFQSQTFANNGLDPRNVCQLPGAFVMHDHIKIFRPVRLFIDAVFGVFPGVVAFVDDRGNAKVYVDGVQDAANFNYDSTYTDVTMNTTAIGTLEGSNISVGRGTDQPFEIFGAPWIDGQKLAKALNGAQMPGLRFVPIEFTPTSSKFSGQPCKGVYIMVSDRTIVEPAGASVIIAWHLRNLFGEAFEIQKIAKLLANADTLKAIQEAVDPRQIPAMWKEGLEEFKKAREKYLIYK